MKLNMENQVLKLNLNPLEMLLSFHGSMAIPLEAVTGASTEKPGWEWGSRAPGTHIPFILKAGTYYVSSGKEFWVTTIGMPYLVIETPGWNYKRIVLTMSENKLWAERINSAIL